MKPLPVEFSREARKDVFSAAAWYESKNRGFGAVFIARVDESLIRISNFPMGGREIYQGVRRVVLRQFRNILFYRIEETRIVIIGCRHERESPASWPAI